MVAKYRFFYDVGLCILVFTMASNLLVASVGSPQWISYLLATIYLSLYFSAFVASGRWIFVTLSRRKAQHSSSGSSYTNAPMQPLTIDECKSAWLLLVLVLRVLVAVIISSSVNEWKMSQRSEIHQLAVTIMDVICLVFLTGTIHSIPFHLWSFN